MERVSWTAFDYTQMETLEPVPRKVGNPAGTKHKPLYLPVIATFDTETSTVVINKCKHSFVYVWMFYLPHLDTMITGRTIEDYAGFCALLSDHIKANLLTYVHNLSFEWQFLSGVYEFGKDGASDVFTVKPRKILQATMFKIEHRCSALLSNLSLKSYTKEMQVEHQKLSGDEFDYTVIRYPWTPIKDMPDPGKKHSEWDYCTNDVVGLAEAVLKEMKMSRKDIYHFPFTSTGFVRQDLRKAVRHISDNLFRQIQPDYQLYKALRRAFRGGDTHANRLTAGQVNPAGYSYDRSSSYPDVQCNHLFPMSAFKPIEDLSIENVLSRHKKYKRAILMNVKFTNIRLNYKNWGFPYIPADHWHTDLPYPKNEIIDGKKVMVDPVEYDNGRVMSSPWVVMTITDIDLDIILKEYVFDDIFIFEAWEARYGMLPPAFTDVVKFYYSMKTSLKGDEEKLVMYNKMKARLNAVYGCTAQDIIKPDLAYDPVTHDWMEMLFDKNTGEYRQPEGEWEVFEQKMQNAWLPYQIAVWTTAAARAELHNGLWNVFEQGGIPLYCDTDSVKYLGDHVTWDKLNERLKKDSEIHGAYAKDISGKLHHMGVWEKEGKGAHSFERFASLGAKKYAYEALEYDEKDKEYPKNIMKLVLHTTIAAVTKEGAAELAAAFGPEALDKFAACRADENTFTFVKAGGTALIYNDADDLDLEIDGHHLHIGRNVVITDDTYRLSLQDDYAALISDYFDTTID